MDTKRTSLEKIHEYLHSTSGNVVLSEQDQAKLERSRAAWDLRIKCYSKTEIANILVDAYGCSRSQAYKDIDFSEKLYSNPTVNEKRAKREVASHYALRMMKRAEACLDYKIGARFLDLYIKANLLDKEDAVLPSPDKLKIPDIVTGIDPRLEQVLVKLIEQQGPTDITKLYNAAKNFEEAQLVDEPKDDLPI